MIQKIIIAGLLVMLALPDSFAADMDAVDRQMAEFEQRQALSMRDLARTDDVFTPAVEPRVASTNKDDSRKDTMTGTMLAANAWPRHALDMGVERYSYRYHEFVGGAKFMNTRGIYHGLVAAYTFRPIDQDTFMQELVNVFRAELRYAAGQVDYTGSGTYSGLKDYTCEVRGIIGKEYSPTTTASFLPYAGLGWRYLNDGLQAYQPGGYERESKYLYIPLGIQAFHRLSGAWGVGMELEYDQLVQGRQISHLEDADPDYDTLRNSQNKGFGLRGALKIIRDLPRMRLSVEPFYRYWHIQASSIDPITSGGELTGWVGTEPENVTQEVGVRLGAQF